MDYHNIEILEELFNDFVEGVAFEVGNVRVSDVEDELKPSPHHVAEVTGLDRQLRQISLEAKITFHVKLLQTLFRWLCIEANAIKIV